VVPPNCYWQTNSPKPGYATAVLFSQRDAQAILGLPLMNGYFTVFDRSVDKGLGVVSFAKMNPNAKCNMASDGNNSERKVQLRIYSWAKTENTQ
jgi:hypothetical protein